MASKSTVAVACKLPHGLQLQLHVMADTPQGKLAKPDGAPVILNGGNHPQAIAGWGLTEGVDAEFMKRWLTDNADNQAVKAGLILVRDRVDGVTSEAKDRKDVKSGFEPLDPKAKPAKITDVDKE